MIPLVDLHSAGLMTGTLLKRGPRTAATGYSAGYLADVARVFRDICFYGSTPQDGPWLSTRPRSGCRTRRKSRPLAVKSPSVAV